MEDDVEVGAGGGGSSDPSSEPMADVLAPGDLAAAILTSTIDGIVAVDTAGRIVVWNGAMERLTGVPAASCLGKPPGAATRELDSDDVRHCFRRALAGESVVASRRRVGEQAFEAHYSPLRDRRGAILGALAVVRDVTAHQRLEEQLLQAQKIEAVGQLAGGIAHDFNNLLTAILGYCELAQLAAPGSDVRPDLAEIHRAAQRAGELTSRLLAFSRKQVLQPKVLDPNREVRELEPMMRRLLGENVKLHMRLASDVGQIHADPGQLQQVLVNLLVNARDAMPDGGRIVVETRNAVLDDEFAQLHTGARPGRFLLLAVSDTGTGMDAATRSRIFEPFFTTKERGKGTGLGLAQVYGVVKQSGGSIWVYSEVGRGTTFKIYLPRVDAPPDPPAEAAPLGQAAARRGETILVAEDEEAVRSLLVRLLRSLGYQVLAAEGGAAALAAAERAPALDLLLTDVVMGDMSGRQLADALHRKWPGLPVLFISGYTDESIAHHGVLDAGVRLLEKPFSSDLLARRVRDVLDDGSD